MGGNQKYCNQKCYWTKLRLLNQANGGNYISINVGGRKIYIHRLVMQKHLNRKLGRDEIVHHKNGIKNDNRLENLELITQSEHIKKHFSKVMIKLKGLQNL